MPTVMTITIKRPLMPLDGTFSSNGGAFRKKNSIGLTIRINYFSPIVIELSEFVVKTKISFAINRSSIHESFY